MNGKSKVIEAGLIGTTYMTILSYALSEWSGHNFKLPNLLGKLFNGWFPFLKNSKSKIAGWQMHYMLGMIWALCYIYLLKRRKKIPTLAEETGFGILSGVTGVITWKFLFCIHPKPPQIPFKAFALQLIADHLVFSLVTAEVYFKKLPD